MKKMLLILRVYLLIQQSSFCHPYFLYISSLLEARSFLLFPYLKALWHFIFAVIFEVLRAGFSRFMVVHIVAFDFYIALLFADLELYSRFGFGILHWICYFVTLFLSG